MEFAIIFLGSLLAIVFVGVLSFGGLVAIASKLDRIARALEEKDAGHLGKGVEG